MSARSKSIEKGPSWFEVGLGAFLSIVLGVVLGAAYLLFKPVQTVKAVPKDAPGGAIYYIEGAHDFNRTEEATEKRKSFAAGESVELEEGEINVLLAAGTPSAPAVSPGKAGQPPAPAAPPKAIDVGPLNIRIHSGKVQFADTVKFNVFSVTGSLVVQADGEFKKDGSEFAFDPDTIYVGGCPVQRLLLVRSWILKKLLFVQPVPDDISAAWPKLADVIVEGSTLRLKMP